MVCAPVRPLAPAPTPAPGGEARARALGNGGVRERWPDLARGLGILLVVGGHDWRGLRSAGILPDGALFESVDRAIYLFHMPLFFLISGILFGRGARGGGDVGDGLAKGWRLLYPMALWTYLFIAAKLVAGREANMPLSFETVDLSPLPPQGHLWFLWALFLAQIVGLVALSSRLRPVVALLSAAALTALVRDPLLSAFPQAATLIAPALRHAPLFLAGAALGASSLGRAGANPEPVAGLAGAALFFGLEAAIAARPGLDSPLAGDAAAAGFLLMAAWLAGRARARLALRGLCALGKASLAIFLAHTLFSAGMRILLTAAGVDDVSIHLAAGLVVGVAGPLALLVAARRFGANRLLGLDGAPRLPRLTFLARW